MSSNRHLKASSSKQSYNAVSIIRLQLPTIVQKPTFNTFVFQIKLQELVVRAVCREIFAKELYGNSKREARKRAVSSDSI